MLIQDQQKMLSQEHVLLGKITATYFWAESQRPKQKQTFWRGTIFQAVTVWELV